MNLRRPNRESWAQKLLKAKDARKVIMNFTPGIEVNRSVPETSKRRSEVGREVHGIMTGTWGIPMLPSTSEKPKSATESCQNDARERFIRALGE